LLLTVFFIPFQYKLNFGSEMLIFLSERHAKTFFGMGSCPIRNICLPSEGFPVRTFYRAVTLPKKSVRRKKYLIKNITVKSKRILFYGQNLKTIKLYFSRFRFLWFICKRFLRWFWSNIKIKVTDLELELKLSKSSRVFGCPTRVKPTLTILV